MYFPRGLCVLDDVAEALCKSREIYLYIRRLLKVKSLFLICFYFPITFMLLQQLLLGFCSFLISFQHIQKIGHQRIVDEAVEDAAVEKSGSLVIAKSCGKQESRRLFRF